MYVERKADPSVATAAAFALESLDLVPWWNADLVILSVEHFGPERMLPKGLKLEVEVYNKMNTVDRYRYGGELCIKLNMTSWSCRT